MQLRNKDKIIENLWLVLAFFVFGAFFYFQLFQNSGNATQNQKSPQVLGESTPVLARGQVSNFSNFGPNKPAMSGTPNLNSVSAQAFLVYDGDSSEILASRNVSEKFAIASLTKLVTGLVVYEKMNLDDFVEITKADSLPVKPALNLQLGDKVKILDLFESMLIGSANDAALALANHTEAKAGVSFIELMNQKAKELNMNNSHFSNPMGFDSNENYSTAEDLMNLVKATQKYYIFSSQARLRDYTFTSELGNSYRVTASNKLISGDKEISSIKTGFTEEARGSMITKATRNGKSIVIIVLSSSDRDKDTEIIKKEILEKYVW